MDKQSRKLIKNYLPAIASQLNSSSSMEIVLIIKRKGYVS